MLFNILSVEIDSIDEDLSPSNIISQIFDVMKRKLSPSPVSSFDFMIAEQITCVLSGGVSTRSVNSRMMEVTLKPTMQEALESWANEELDDFFSPTMQCQSPGLRCRKLVEAPDQLIISVKRFFKNNNWVDEEYQVPMAIDDKLNLTWLRQNEAVESTMQVEHDNLAPTGTVRILIEMGFSEKLARKALDRTAWDVEAAADWCCMHMEDAEVSNASSSVVSHEDPEEAYHLSEDADGACLTNEEIIFRKVDLTSNRQRVFEFDYTPKVRKMYMPTELDIQQLELLGIHRLLAIKSLRICGGSVERAADWAFNNFDTPTDDVEEVEPEQELDENEIVQKANEVN